MTIYDLSISSLILLIFQYLPLPFLACDERSTDILIVLLIDVESLKVKQILKLPTDSFSEKTGSNVTFT